MFCMHKFAKNTKAIRLYMEDLEIDTVYPTFNWDNITISIYVVDYKRVTPRVNQIDITVFSLR